MAAAEGMSGKVIGNGRFICHFPYVIRIAEREETFSCKSFSSIRYRNT